MEKDEKKTSNKCAHRVAGVVVHLAAVEDVLHVRHPARGLGPAVRTAERWKHLRQLT